MVYIEFNIRNFQDFDPEIIMAQLSELGFESFTETDDTLQGYIREDLYDADVVGAYLLQLHSDHAVTFDMQAIPAQNWNALWESAYDAVTIAGRCQVRAPFHQPRPGIAYDIVIEPRMSFGTAHHETTSLMLALLLDEHPEGSRVLDMGCGTGVLAILAYKMKAAQVVAIDNDDWAYANALDNMNSNDAGEVKVLQGDASMIPLPAYDLVLANINRNVLLNDIPVYAGYLNDHGTLLVSGFYEQDLEMIREVAVMSGLIYVSHKQANNWVGAKFVK
ncbi:MAG: 50S ribosomal protein L11 methyltransferase [Bacteroidota bacterium]